MASSGTHVRTAIGRSALVGTLVAALFATAFVLQGLRDWRGIFAATFVNIAPPALLGVAAWRFAVRQPDRARRWPALVAMHAAAAVLYAGAWTAAVATLVRLLQPNAAANFVGAAVWHFVGGIMVYGMIAGLAHAHSLGRRLKEQELAAARAELVALRAQLDPHFLFNTLHSIQGLVRQDPPTAEQAIERFGGLMRYTLHAGRAGLVPLEDELAFVKDYLELEALRLGERLDVSISIDEDCLDAGVPALLLQPLVENAVRHGIAPLRQGGRLQLIGRLCGAGLCLSIIDDGGGASLRGVDESSGVGLSATRRQLHAYFGAGADLRVETSPGCGFAVHLSLPLMTPEIEAG